MLESSTVGFASTVLVTWQRPSKHLNPRTFSPITVERTHERVRLDDRCRGTMLSFSVVPD